MYIYSDPIGDPILWRLGIYYGDLIYQGWPNLYHVGAAYHKSKLLKSRKTKI